MQIGNSGIYWIRNKISNKIYIGQSVNFKKRFYHHEYELNKNIHGNKYLQNEWNKYGKDNFEFLILQKCCIEELTSLEQGYVNFFESNDRARGYNFNDCVTNPFLGKKHSEETKKFLSESRKGELSPWFNKKHSQITINKIRQALLGHKTLDETKNKISKSLKERFSCQNHPNFGKKMTSEQREKISQNSGQKFKLISPNKLIVKGKNISKFCRENKISRTGIKELIRGTYKQYKGWTKP